MEGQGEAGAHTFVRQQEGLGDGDGKSGEGEGRHTGGRRGPDPKLIFSSCSGPAQQSSSHLPGAQHCRREAGRQLQGSFPQPCPPLHTGIRMLTTYFADFKSYGDSRGHFPFKTTQMR